MPTTFPYKYRQRRALNLKSCYSMKIDSTNSVYYPNVNEI